MKRRIPVRLLVGVVMLGIVSAAPICDSLFQGVDANIPVVELSENATALVDYPDLSALGSYFCRRLLDFPEDLVCDFFAAPPTKEELQFRFQIVLDIANPNQIPVPTTEVLVALHIYPDQTFGELGGICTTLCEAGADNCPIPPEGACVRRPEDIDTADELIEAAIGGAIVLAADLLNGEPIAEHLGLYTIPAGEDLQLKITFAIGIDPMLALLEHTAEDYLYTLLDGQTTQLDIPYLIAGRVWFDVPYLGRASVGFGPYGDVEEPLIWRIF